MELKAFENNSHYLYLAFIILLPILFSITRRRKLHLPPGPYAWPIIGNFYNLDSKKPHISLTKLGESFGPLISLRFGSKLVIVASTPNASKEVYKFHDRELSGRPKLQIVKKIRSKDDNSTIAIEPECDHNWRLLRGMSHTELFSYHALESKCNIRIQKVAEMLRFLRTKDGEEVVIADIIFVTLVNSLSAVMVSNDVTSWENVEQMKSYLRKVIKFGIPGLGDIYPGIARFLDFESNQKLRDYLEICEVLWGGILKERRGLQTLSDANPRDFLDVLLKNSWDDNKIYSSLMEFLVSTQTMTTITEWVMTELIRHPKALAKLRDEVSATAVNGSSILSDHELTKLVYLQAVIKETFRLHPPSPFLVPRAAVQTCKLMGYVIPKESVIVINAYALGRDSETWNDPLSFKPERFLESGMDLKGCDYELLPFGSGRRICVGMNMALREIQLLIASLVHAFDWTLPLKITDPKDLDMSENFGIVLRKEEPLILIPKKKIDCPINEEY